MIFSMPTKKSTTDSRITNDKNVSPGNAKAIIDKMIANAPRPIWAARIQLGDLVSSNFYNVYILKYISTWYFVSLVPNNGYLNNFILTCILSFEGIELRNNKGRLRVNGGYIKKIRNVILYTSKGQR